MAETELIPMWSLLATTLAFLATWGIALVAAGSLPAAEARQAALVPLAAFALAAVGYVVAGFGLHYGGIGLRIDHPDFETLVWEWSALSEEWGPTWGMAGLAGFGMEGLRGALVYTLFLSALPWAAAAAMLPMLALRGRAPAVVVALFGLLTAAVAFPVIGNWIQGGGWLANLGFNVGMGHGFVDFGGSALFALGGGVTLASILTFLKRRPPQPEEALPPVHLPLLAMLGAGLIVVGSAGWLLANPLSDWAAFDPAETITHALLAAAAGSFLPLFYTWFIASRADALLGARGVAAGWVAGLAAAPFAPANAMLLIGGGAGLLMVLATFVVDHRLRLEDPGGLLATFGLPALWGLLALGVFADGAAGAGYNAIGGGEYLGVVGQGVTGLRAGAGFTPDWPGQMQAQAIGAAVIFLLGFLVTSILAAPLAVAARAWSRESEDEIEQPVVDADGGSEADEEPLLSDPPAANSDAGSDSPG